MHRELWVSRRPFDGRCSLKSWVYRIAHNVGASHVMLEIGALQNKAQGPEPGDGTSKISLDIPEGFL
jgi:DNA-directed RNA polymerase specialized sigma24 family protein